MEHFLITSAISMTVLLAVYHLLLEREKMHRFNRFYLLGAITLSLAIPFITLPVVIEAVPQPVDTIPVVAMFSGTATIAPVATVNYWPYIGWGIYSIVTLVVTIRFAINVRRFYTVKRSAKTLAYEGADLVIVKDDILPHTFLDNIFISEKDYQERLSAPELFTHELTHMRQRHTIDILFIEAVKTLLWFNPLVYLYKRDIQMNHEFLADENVVSRHPDVPAYQRLLLEKAFPAPAYTLASNINFNITKKRFIMMTKTTTKARAAVLQLAVLPITAALMLLSCSTSEIESKTTSAVLTENIAPTGSVEVTTVTEAEKKELLVTDPKTFDDPSAGYMRIKITDKEKDGSTTEKITYKKEEPLQYEKDPLSAFAKINSNDIVSIDVMSVSETEMDSLKTLDQKKYGQREAKDHSVIVCKLKDGTVIKEVMYRKPVTVK